jgi:hypothetical protein
MDNRFLNYINVGGKNGNGVRIYLIISLALFIVSLTFMILSIVLFSNLNETSNKVSNNNRVVKNLIQGLNF